MKIAIAGTGYVGLSNAMLLAPYNEVVALDIVPEKVDLINTGHSPIQNLEIEDFFAKGLGSSISLMFRRVFSCRIAPWQKILLSVFPKKKLIMGLPSWQPNKHKSLRVNEQPRRSVAGFFIQIINQSAQKS